MTILLAANDSSARAAPGRTHEETLGIELPAGHVGPVLLSGTGRTVWWTGRVAIGLRYEPPRYTQVYGSSELWIQRSLLKCG